MRNAQHWLSYVVLKTRLYLTLFLLINFSAFGQGQYIYKEPPQLNDGWNTNDLRLSISDSSRLYAFFNQINTEEHKLHSFLLVKNNELVLEEYFNGYNAAKIQDIRSVNKSIKSILLGIALDKGFINDINDPISKYLTNYQPKKKLDPRKDEITIKHLITMSAGWDCNDWDKRSKGQEDRVYKKDNWIQYTLDLPMINNPGEVSNYCSMGVLIMAEIISQSSGMSIQDFAEKYLFKPLSIENKEWGHTSERALTSSSKRLYLTPRELAKIGQLVMNKGKWGNTQVVSKEWIEQATTSYTQITGMDYGYLWWNIPFPSAKGPLIAKTATGNGGQYIMIFEELDMVAIFTGGAYNSEADKLPFAITNNILLPSFDENP